MSLVFATMLLFSVSFALVAEDNLSLTRGIPPGGAYESTYQIEYRGNLATGFSIEIDKRQYLITARHVIDGFQAGDNLNIRINQEWYTVDAKPIFLSNQQIDIAALALKEAYFQPAQIQPNAGLYLGQEAYFLGFPYGLASDFTLKRKIDGASFPLRIPTTYPFIKRSIVSSLGGENQVFYLDGHNNPGFSGGPIIVGDLSKKAGKEEIGVAGVVSAYKSQLLEVIDSVSQSNVSTQQKEQIVTRYVAENAGIIVAYRMQPMIDAIRANPIGPLLK
ncbi:MAG: serine protease [Acidiferrobacterales bacterium]|nr:serine protease [Acidiferrobacterales bacterium]